MADLDQARLDRYFDLVMPDNDYWRKLRREPNQDNGRYALPTNVTSGEMDTRGILETCLVLIDSDDPLDRVLADHLLDVARHGGVHLPDGMWCVTTTYADGKQDGRPFAWSAHFTREEAERWLPAWQKKLASRTDYVWEVRQLDGVQPHALRHPDADPMKCMR